MAIYDACHAGFRVFIGDLGSSVRKHALEKHFASYGSIRDVWLARNPPGFAFIVFKYRHDAERVVRHLAGKNVCGRCVRVEHAQPYALHKNATEHKRLENGRVIDTSHNSRNRHSRSHSPHHTHRHRDRSAEYQRNKTTYHYTSSRSRSHSDRQLHSNGHSLRNNTPDPMDCFLQQNVGSRHHNNSRSRSSERRRRYKSQSTYKRRKRSGSQSTVGSRDEKRKTALTTQAKVSRAEDKRDLEKHDGRHPLRNGKTGGATSEQKTVVSSKVTNGCSKLEDVAASDLLEGCSVISDDSEKSLRDQQATTVVSASVTVCPNCACDLTTGRVANGGVVVTDSAICDDNTDAPRTKQPKIGDGENEVKKIPARLRSSIALRSAPDK